VQGWRYQLALFSKAAAEEGRPRAVEHVDAFLRAWGDPDAGRRRALLESCATPEVVFRDAYSATSGREDLLANLEAVQLHMPGIVLARDGEVNVSHGSAIVRWTAEREGRVVARRVNFYDLSPDGRIARVVGFWEG
jgi:hypothetical protein